MSLRLHAPVVLPCDSSCSVLRDAVVDVVDGRITYVGGAAEAPAFDGEIRRLSGILLPGLVNTHAHSPMTVLRGLGSDLPLLRWLQEQMWPNEARMTAADVGTGMLLGAVEMLRHGVTTSAEMYFHGPELVSSVLAAGSRVVFGAAILDVPGMSWRSMTDEISAWIDADGLQFADGRVELAYGPHSAYTLSPAQLTSIAGEARARGALLMVHVAESPFEDEAQRAEFGSVPALLKASDVLGGRVLSAHSVHLSDDDIALYASFGVGVAHCPGSNAKLASGIARVPEMLAAGVPVGLGTDGPASNDDLDLFEEARLAGLFARVSKMDATVLGAAQALLMATRGGAAALGRDDIGALEAGRWGDVVHVDADDPAFATGLDAPDSQLLANLVWASGARRITDVWVGGEHVVAGGESTRVDRQEAQAGVTAVAQRLRNT
ncbi:5-methylthioadenosine/S-adenosylhomocysteine deaminase [Lentzea atacamensis]|uniref:5-methylthioadenosine/S-adenosylhomocysteine deaminase n=1 Tax=Lentzea atacamensis TaxID=531938 RepID=A0A316ITV8_9PSEU|nr:amidohydrolase [Lentzea atacamensis]PWK90605.1 5-methylthioadenosine/S-adenosylhomocysteine deaminase [Lentzea atacamensis]RAS68171.1 5-methylthioadenosine/S-adenosylhomocysteine deaminase [Lentzea atacamensis]